jgi:hypothetical protein
MVAEITRTTGRRYSLKLEALDDESLRELQRHVRDLDNPSPPVRSKPQRENGTQKHLRPQATTDAFRV